MSRWINRSALERFERGEPSLDEERELVVQTKARKDERVLDVRACKEFDTRAFHRADNLELLSEDPPVELVVLCSLRRQAGIRRWIPRCPQAKRHVSQARVGNERRIIE